MVRITTGSARGVSLFTPEGDSTRPTSARIKEGVFSSIQFEIEGRRVLDLFAGSGQLALEALSRGADSATLIDASREALAIAKKNADKTRLIAKCHFLASDFRTYLGKAKERFDLVFIDPPYGMHAVAEAVRRLVEKHLLFDGAIIVAEGSEEDPFSGLLPAGITLRRTLRYSISYVHILTYREEQTE